jgi:hypothetical protein
MVSHRSARGISVCIRWSRVRCAESSVVGPNFKPPQKMDTAEDVVVDDTGGLAGGPMSTLTVDDFEPGAAWGATPAGDETTDPAEGEVGGSMVGVEVVGDSESLTNRARRPTPFSFAFGPALAWFRKTHPSHHLEAVMRDIHVSRSRMSLLLCSALCVVYRWG